MEQNEFLDFRRKTDNDIRTLKIKNNVLLILVLAGLSVVLITKYLPNRSEKFESIRAKMVIVEDERGNDRIIISSKISSTNTRVRSDTLEGVLILDENGHDRVILGESSSVNINGKIVKRATNGPYGIAFNDENGFEKGGLGYYADRGLSALGLDGPSGEGIALFVPKDELFGQKVGIIINDPQKGGQLIYIGANTRGQRIFNMNVQNIGQFSIEVDSIATTRLKSIDFVKQTERVLLK